MIRSLKYILIAGALTTPALMFAESLLVTDSPQARQSMTWNSPTAINAAPDFLIIGKSDRFYVGVGGNVTLTASFDPGRSMSNPNEFITSEIPMGKTPGNNGTFSFSAQQTQLYLNMVAFPSSKNRVGGFVGINFLGNNYLPELVYAYIRWRGLQAGYDYNLFSDSEAIPPSIDYEGANSITAQGTAGVRYSLNFGKRKEWCAQIGAELPMLSPTQSVMNEKNFTEPVTQKVPDIPVALQYSWESGAHIRLSGVLRNLYSRSVAENKNIDHLGWGIQLSGSGEILPGLTAYSQIVYGKGIASYFQDLNGLGLDMVPSPSGRNLSTVRCWGAYGALQYAFSDKFSVVGTYSQVRSYPDEYPDGEAPFQSQYRYAQYAAGTFYYNITSNLTSGIEYIWGKRVDCNGEKGVASRIQAALIFSF